MVDWDTSDIEDKIVGFLDKKRLTKQTQYIILMGMASDILSDLRSGNDTDEDIELSEEEEAPKPQRIKKKVGTKKIGKRNQEEDDEDF